MHVLFGGHTCEFQKAHDFKLCCCFLLPVDVCIDVDFILAYVMIGSYNVCLARVNSLHSCNSLQGKTFTKEMLVTNVPAHVAVRLQLLEINSITTLNQTILNVCTRYIFQTVLF